MLTLLRLILSAAGVLVGLRLKLHFIQAAHMGILVPLLKYSGVAVKQLGEFTFTVRQLPIVITSACTSIEVFLGLAPLLWRRSWGLLQGLIYLLGAGALFELANILRLYLGLLFFAHGLSWSITHTIPSGVFYAIALYLSLRVGGWIKRDSERYVSFALPDRK